MFFFVFDFFRDVFRFFFFVFVLFFRDFVLSRISMLFFHVCFFHRFLLANVLGSKEQPETTES